ncbi:hypothetical protein D3C85_1059660 [compost metagenome]
MLGVLPADPAGLRRQDGEVAAFRQGGGIGLHDLQMIRQLRRGQRGAGLRVLCQRMRGAHDRHHLHGPQGLHRDAGMPEMLARENAQRMAARQKRRHGAAQRQHRNARGHGRIGRAHEVQRGADLRDREQRVHHQRQLQLHAFAQPQRAGAHGVHPQEYVAGIGKQSLALRGHDGTVAATVKKRHAQLRFHVGDGVADRRLHARQLTGGGAKAAGIRHGGEYAKLVQGQGVYHRQADLFIRASSSKDYHLSESAPAGMMPASWTRRGRDGQG